ncbi:NAD-dependent epimerase/dehydratase family protein [Brooklawnia propionicigenes]|uniref:NAD-dependent epimerase/dehydratase family protein n=1 Tax=Brooklawnia propionicigenes TaxID=3041175 RepID=A0AAN0KIS1_9ACTN|nr:NAD-dependent epimerase/dehydratase family protein [Brooklawnia sp. SH051]BEH02685.1 NAD-dependent epimerase/dehydratase family protein [Brooklawnia sp. SH051]
MTATADLHVIVGAGPVGVALATRLAGEGHHVRVLTRSGRDLKVPEVESIAVDASDIAALTSRVTGASVLYNCANPGSYTQWEKLWPPLAASILSAAERSGAVLATASNLYGYGRVDAPMTRRTPLRPCDHKGALRARMWQQALAAHESGRVRVTELRSSDYIGPTLPVSSGLLARYADATLQGRTATVFADPDQPHTWTAIDDVAATLAVLGRDERAWGSAWIAPSNPPATVREVLRGLAEQIGAVEPRVRQVPGWLLRTGAITIPLLREVSGVLYQFDAPFIADGSETSDVFGIAPSPWHPLLAETARAWAERAGKPTR